MAIASGAAATLACAEANVPPGSWRYTVTPVLGAWHGPESPRSAAVAVAPDAPSLTSATAQNPAAGQATGAIAIFVSHRFSTVRMADTIIVVDGGQIAESGTHDELIALGGIYAELFALQASAYAA